MSHRQNRRNSAKGGKADRPLCCVWLIIHGRLLLSFHHLRTCAPHDRYFWLSEYLAHSILSALFLDLYCLLTTDIVSVYSKPLFCSSAVHLFPYIPGAASQPSLTRSNHERGGKFTIQEVYRGCGG